MKRLLNFFSLFGSLSTLLCCALPVVLVSLGMGATFAGLTSMFPQIIWLTERKDLLFVITGVLLILSYLAIRQSRTMVCPIDEKQEVCQTSKSVSYTLLIFSCILYLIGGFFSYILPLFYGD